MSLLSDFVLFDKAFLNNEDGREPNALITETYYDDEWFEESYQKGNKSDVEKGKIIRKWKRKKKTDEEEEFVNTESHVTARR